MEENRLDTLSPGYSPNQTPTWTWKSCSRGVSLERVGCHYSHFTTKRLLLPLLCFVIIEYAKNCVLTIITILIKLMINNNNNNKNNRTFVNFVRRPGQPWKCHLRKTGDLVVYRVLLIKIVTALPNRVFGGEGLRSKFEQEHAQKERQMAKISWMTKTWPVGRHWCRASRVRGYGMIWKDDDRMC